MNVTDQIEEYIAIQSEPKRHDMQELHHIILKTMPACKLWFLPTWPKRMEKNWVRQA